MRHLAGIRNPEIMPTKNEILAVRALRDRKTRWAERKFIVEGRKMVEEALSSGWELQAVYATEGNMPGSLEPTEWVSVKAMERMSAMRTAPGVLAVVRMPEGIQDGSAGGHGDSPLLSIALDGMADPGNLGTIIRTADWFGVSDIWISEDSVDVFNPKVVQATMGAIFRVNIRVCHLSTALKGLKSAGACIWGLDLEGDSLWNEARESRPTVAVLGSESHGISAEVREVCTAFIHIPGAGLSESLNAAMAAGIVMAVHDGLRRRITAE